MAIREEPHNLQSLPCSLLLQGLAWLGLVIFRSIFIFRKIAGVEPCNRKRSSALLCLGGDIFPKLCAATTDYVSFRITTRYTLTPLRSTSPIFGYSICITGGTPPPITNHYFSAKILERSSSASVIRFWTITCFRQ